MSRSLTYATVCSGIECMSVAARGLPLRPVFFSEIEPFPCAVLKARYPDVPNLGDMSKIKVLRPAAPAAVSPENPMEITNGTTRLLLNARLDILAGGTPCQDVSVAGKRAGMAEGTNTRSSLAFDFVRLARELRPRYVIWENVSGSIDSKNAPDFLAFLRALGDCGYSLAWRVLDAQYVRVDGMERAVPQRRRRVWVVGYSGTDESRAAEILFEPEGVAGHTPPRRIAGQGFAYSLVGRDRVDAGLVGSAPGTGDEGELPVLDMMGGKPGSHFTTDGSSPTLTRGRGSVNDVHAIALYGDKLKPRTDQRKGGNGFGVNEDGAGYIVTATDRHGVAYGIGNGQAAEASATIRECSQTLNCMHDKQAMVHCFENHAQDSRVRDPIDTAPTQGSSNANSAGVSGNNPLVVHTAYKLDPISSNSMKSANPHSGIHKTEVAACLDTTPPDPSKNQGGNVIVSTNSNGEDVAPTLDHNTGSTNGIGAQNDKRGGYVIQQRAGGGMCLLDESRHHQ